MNPRHIDENNDSSFNTAIKYLDIAIAYQSAKQYKKAEKYFLKIIDIFEELVTPYCCEEYWSCLAASYNALAVMLHDTEDVYGAQTYYLCAIDVMEGRVDANKLEHVSNLVACYSCLGELTEDEECFRKAYTYAKLFPDEPICKDVIETWSNTF